jgi:asparagine synthase (glutamine-hydrolysing)
MCGIAGIVSWGPCDLVSRARLSAASAALAHRGPDDERLFLNHDADTRDDRPRVGLAFRRLAVIDPDPRSMQPMHSPDGRFTLVFNGEIYNFRELRNELSTLLPAHEWRTRGDAEVLLMSYVVWKDRCVDHLNGMYAFAVWDERQGSLFLATDPTGQKPLYVAGLKPHDDEWLTPDPLAAPSYTVDKVFAFASELSALRALGKFDTSLDRHAVAAYLSLGYVPSGMRIGDVVKLRPSHTVTIRRGAAEARSNYFRTDGAFDDNERSDRTDECRTLVEQAVRRQMVADVPLGCFLSGGIDSSVIALAMTRAVDDPKQVHTFSIGFDDPRYDETRYAAAVARHLGTTHRVFTVRPDAADDLPKLARVFGEPFGDSSALPTHYLALETRKHVTVALSGDGGDELFGGYDRYRALLLSSRFDALPRMIGATLARAARLVPGSHPKSFGARLKRFTRGLLLSPAERYASYLRLFSPEQVAELLDEPIEPVDPLEALFSVGLSDRGLVPNALALDRASYLPDDLHTKVDRASMLHALEVRAPFMDRDVLAFARRLNTRQLLRGGGKRQLRLAFARDLPAFVFRRRKMGFAVPIGQWFRNSLRDMLRDHLFASDSFARRHLQLGVVERMVEEHERDTHDHSQRLYALLMLELSQR